MKTVSANSVLRSVYSNSNLTIGASVSKHMDKYFDFTIRKGMSRCFSGRLKNCRFCIPAKFINSVSNCGRVDFGNLRPITDCFNLASTFNHSSSFLIVALLGLSRPLNVSRLIMTRVIDSINTVSVRWSKSDFIHDLARIGKTKFNSTLNITMRIFPFAVGITPSLSFVKCAIFWCSSHPVSGESRFRLFAFPASARFGVALRQSSGSDASVVSAIASGDPEKFSAVIFPLASAKTKHCQSMEFHARENFKFRILGNWFNIVFSHLSTSIGSMIRGPRYPSWFSDYNMETCR